MKLNQLIKILQEFDREGYDQIDVFYWGKNGSIEVKGVRKMIDEYDENEIRWI